MRWTTDIRPVVRRTTSTRKTAAPAAIPVAIGIESIGSGLLSAESTATTTRPSTGRVNGSRRRGTSSARWISSQPTQMSSTPTPMTSGMPTPWSR